MNTTWIMDTDGDGLVEVKIRDLTDEQLTALIDEAGTAGDMDAVTMYRREQQKRRHPSNSGKDGSR